MIIKIKTIIFILTFCISINILAQKDWVAQQSVIKNKWLTSIFFTDENTGYIVGVKNTSGLIYKTINGGKQWNIVNESISGLISVFFSDSRTGYAVGGVGQILKTNDKGATWIIHKIDSSYFLTSVFFVDPRIGFAVGCYSDTKSRPHVIYSLITKTIDGGATWIVQKQDILGCWLQSVYFTNKNIGYAVGFIKGDSSLSGIILKTINGGLSWTVQSKEFKTRLQSVYFCDSINGFVVGYNGTIFKTIDGGINWISKNQKTEYNLQSVCFANSKIGFAVGGAIENKIWSAVILKTDDGGEKWTRDKYKLLNENLYSLFIKGNSIYSTGTNGSILKKSLTDK